MTDSDRPTAGQVAQLTRAVERVGRAVVALTSRLNLFKIGLVLTAFGLALDLALSWLFFLFFQAETDKVAGQIVGERMQRDAEQQILTNPRGGLVKFEHGTDKWIGASQHYLNDIHFLNGFVITAWCLTGLGVLILLIELLRRMRRRRALGKN